MLLYEGIHGGARYTCATIRMVSTNKVCALPRISRILREIFLPDSNFFFSTDLALAHCCEPMRLATSLLLVPMVSFLYLELENLRIFAHNVSPCGLLFLALVPLLSFLYLEFETV